MADQRHTRGRNSEAAAADHLLKAGLRQIAANSGSRLGELDLVMLDHDADGEVLVFVEVRYRKHTQFGGGAASVDVHKRRRLVRAAGQFLATHPGCHGLPCRFDVIAASGDPATPQLEWIRDAFREDD